MAGIGVNVTVKIEFADLIEDIVALDEAGNLNKDAILEVIKKRMVIAR